MQLQENGIEKCLSSAIQCHLGNCGEMVQIALSIANINVRTTTFVNENSKIAYCMDAHPLHYTMHTLARKHTHTHAHRSLRFDISTIAISVTTDEGSTVRRIQTEPFKNCQFIVSQTNYYYTHQAFVVFSTVNGCCIPSVMFNLHFSYI